MLTLLIAEKDKKCDSAVKFLDAAGVKYAKRDIIADRPSVDELKKWIEMSGASAFAFLRSGGFLLGGGLIAERMAMMNDESRVAYLTATGKIIRRPLLVGETFVLIGFDESTWLRRIKQIKSEQ